MKHIELGKIQTIGPKSLGNVLVVYKILGGSSEAIITVNFEEDFFRAAFRAPGVFVCGSSRFILIKGDQEVSKTCLFIV